jgi:hypothetical protein
LSDRSANNLGIVFRQLGADALFLVDLFALVDDKVGLLADLAGNCLVLANHLLADSMVDRVKEVEEAG